MSNRTPRPAQPRRWTSLAMVGATAGLAAGAPGVAQMATAPQLGPAQIVLVQAQSGQQGDAPAVKPASEGGEGGESGLTAAAPPEQAYLADLAIVEGHFRAAAVMYAKGMAAQAIELSYHPEQEMMDGVRASLTAHGASDFSPLMVAISEAMAAGTDQATVQAKLDALHAAIAAAAGQETGAKTRFQSLVLLAKAAAEEYAGAVQDGKVAEPMGYHEAWAFLQIASEQAAALAASPDPVVAKVATKVSEALTGSAAAFGDIHAAEMLAADPGILSAVAGRVELAASQVR